MAAGSRRCSLELAPPLSLGLSSPSWHLPLCLFHKPLLGTGIWNRTSTHVMTCTARRRMLCPCQRPWRCAAGLTLPAKGGKCKQGSQLDGHQPKAKQRLHVAANVKGGIDNWACELALG